MDKIVAIILGNRMNDDGTISKIQEERLELALEIEKKFNPDYYILTGGSPNEKAGRSEAEGMYEYLINKGINKDKLIKEEQSLSTYQNAEFSVPIVKELKANVVIVCSSGYHFVEQYSHTVEYFLSGLKDNNIRFMIYTK